MKNVLVFLGLLALSLSASWANETDSRRIVYNGVGQSQSVNLNTEETRIEYRWVQVPYTERVCRMETRYRQECRTIPGGQVCRNIPGGQTCRNVPGRRVCRRNPRGGQTCRQEPPRRVCRQNPPRRQCRQRPPQRQCRQVPYQQQVCRNVTRYRQERRAFTVVDARTNAQVTFNFTPMIYRSAGVNVELNADLTRSMLTVRGQDYSNPALLIKDEITLQDRQGPRTSYTINEVHQITLVETNKLFSPIRSMIQVRDLIAGKLELETGRVFYPQELNFKMRILHNGSVLLDRRLQPHEYRLAHLEGRSRILIQLSQIIGNLPVGSILNFDFQASLNAQKYLNRPINVEWQKNHQFSRVLR